MRQGMQRLVEIPHGLKVGRPRHGPFSRLPEVHQGFVPYLSPQGMVGQAFDLLGHPVGRGSLEGLHNLGVQDAPPFLQEAAIGHLVRQGMLEGVFALGEQARLVEELGSLELRQAAVQASSGTLL